ncbi:MAG: hypothetical protein RLZZ460_641 [Chloroflexota bacterium]
MESKSLKGKSRDEARCLSAESTAASRRLADHQVKGCRAILDIEIRERAAADEFLVQPNAFVKGEGEHLGGGEALADQPLHLVAAERFAAMAREAHQFRIGIPAFEGWQGIGGVWAQRDALAHEDRLVSAEHSLGIRSDHAATVYDRPDA